MNDIMKYRPWGSLDWIFSNLLDTKYHFIGCVGTEDRSVVAFEELIKQSRISSQSFVEVLDIDSDFSAAAKDKRLKNFEKLKSIGVIQAEVTPINLLAKEDDIVGWIEESLRDATNIVIDISSLPKRFFFPAIKLLLKHEQTRDLLVTYTAPSSYNTGNIAERPSDWRALPLFGPQDYPDPKYELAVVGVGFLPFGLPDLLKSGFLDAKPHLFFPFPASPATYFKAWDFVRQIEASITLTGHDQLVRINGMDPSDTFDHICWLTEANRKKVLFAPYGPKPMSLGMAIYATLTESPVFYTQPRVYHPDYSIGVRFRNSKPEVYVYCLRLDGRNLFSI